MASSHPVPGALEVVDEDLFEIFHEQMELSIRLSSHVSGADSRAIGK